jgi:hypothetical protein
MTRLLAHVYPWVWWAFALWGALWESLAIGTGNSRWTLSDYIWRMEDIGAGWSALRYFVAAACLFLFFHLAFGWLR